MTRTFRLTFALAAVALVAGPLSAQAPRRLTLDAIYSPDRRVSFSGTPAPDVSWIDDATYITLSRSSRGVEWSKVTADTGAARPLFDAAQMEAALATVRGVSREEAARSARSNDLVFNPSRTAALLTIAGDLYVYDLAARRAVRLT